MSTQTFNPYPTPSIGRLVCKLFFLISLRNNAENVFRRKTRYGLASKTYIFISVQLRRYDRRRRHFRPCHCQTICPDDFIRQSTRCARGKSSRFHFGRPSDGSLIRGQCVSLILRSDGQHGDDATGQLPPHPAIPNHPLAVITLFHPRARFIIAAAAAAAVTESRTLHYTRLIHYYRYYYYITTAAWAPSRTR